MTDNRDLTATEAFKKKIEPFLNNNPSCKIEPLNSGEENVGFAVYRPWDDPSLALLYVNESDDDFANLLNKLKLPKLLSAIIHTETNVLEVIWTCLALQDSQKDVLEREFDFSFRGKTHHCKFAESSPELVELSSHIVFQSTTETNFRNFTSFVAFNSPKNRERVSATFDRPRSFFISDFGLDEGKIIEFVQHLNFYIRYFDRRSPILLLHFDMTAHKQETKTTRYVHKSFPSSIRAADLDSNLLNFLGSKRNIKSYDGFCGLIPHNGVRFSSFC